MSNPILVVVLSLAALCLAAAPARAADAPAGGKGAADGGSIEVQVVGIVRTGIMAIGGETTGTTVTALGFTWELDLAGNKEWADLAQKHDGKELVVHGTLTVKQGVERGRRVIVVVKKLMPVTK